MLVTRLLNKLPLPVPGELANKAKVLNGYCIPTRYPNGRTAGGAGGAFMAPSTAGRR